MKIPLLNGHYRHEAETIFIESWKFSEIMDVNDEMHI